MLAVRTSAHQYDIPISFKAQYIYDKLVAMVESFKEKQIDAKLLEDIMYLQVLVKEAE